MVDVGSRQRIVPGVEGVVRFGNVENANVGRQALIQRPQNGVGRREATLRFGLGTHAQVRHLSSRVDSGVGSPSGLNLHLGVKEILCCLPELPSHGPCVILLLPAAVLGAVVFQRELPGFQSPSIAGRSLGWMVW